MWVLIKALFMVGKKLLLWKFAFRKVEMKHMHEIICLAKGAWHCEGYEKISKLDERTKNYILLILPSTPCISHIILKALLTPSNARASQSQSLAPRTHLSIISPTFACY